MTGILLPLVGAVMAWSRDLSRNPGQPHLPTALTNLICKYLILATPLAY